MLIDLRMSALGHDVVTTHDSVEANARLLACEFSLLVSCNMAPDSMGEQLVAHLRASPGFGAFPIITSNGAGHTGKSTSVDASFAMGKANSLRTLSDHVERLLCAAPA